MNEMKQKGLLTELHCQVAFTELGFLILSPSSEDSRYDFVVDIGNKFLRVQCKTSSLNEDKTAIQFSCRSTRSNTQLSTSRHYTKDEIDYFYTYFNGQSYLVPVEECSTEKSLRFVAPKSGQIAKISFAKDYELKVVLQREEKIETFQEIIYPIPLIENDKEPIIKTQEKKAKTSPKDACPICGRMKTVDAERCVKCAKEA